MFFTNSILATLTLIAVTSTWITIKPGGVPLLESAPGYLVQLGVLGVSFALVLTSLLWTRKQRPLRPIDLVIGSLASTGLASVALLMLKVPTLASIYLIAFAGTVSLLIMLIWIKGFASAKLIVLMLTLIGATTFHFAVANRADTPAQPSFKKTFVDSNLYNLEIRTYSDYFIGSRPLGGGIAPLHDGYLLVDADGRFYWFKEDAGEETLRVQPLGLRAPVNVGAFTTAMQGKNIRLDWFRAIDTLPVQTGGKLNIFVTHHHWDEVNQCTTLRLSRIQIDAVPIPEMKFDADWSVVFESSPCLPLKERGHLFGGNQAGGRMAMIDEHTMLFTVGDFQFDGVDTDVFYSQDPTSSYGKVLSFDLETGTTAEFAKGFRNPQGLIVASNGDILTTEHGPQGGDELNLVENGKNYGWPLVTYGVNYGSHAWPLSTVQENQDGYEKPLFAWVPSPGLSNLVEIRGDSFDRWRGNLIITSLRGRTLLRMKLEDSRPVLIEPIPFGQRIRDIEENADGSIVLWLDFGKVAVITPSLGNRSGLDLWSQCMGCHQRGDGNQHAIGPDLHGIVGRSVASVSNFVYSEALSRAGGRWTEDRLDRFLENPGRYIPGNAMMFEGIEDKDARARLIQYLKDDAP